MTKKRQGVTLPIVISAKVGRKAGFSYGIRIFFRNREFALSHLIKETSQKVFLRVFARRIAQIKLPYYKTHIKQAKKIE